MMLDEATVLPRWVSDPLQRQTGGSDPSGSGMASDFLAEQVRRFETALGHMNQGLSMFDADRRLVVCNPRYHEIFGLAPGTLSVGMTQEEVCRILVANRCYPASVSLEGLMGGTLQAVRNRNGAPVLRTLANGRVLSVLYRATERGGWVSTFEDITEQRLGEARIAHLARHDGLTDLVNGRTLREEGWSLLDAEAQAAPLVAVLHLDLDRFKVVNDTFGHAVGDELLRAVAGRLRDAAAPGGIVSRLGGDEFALIRGAADEAEVLGYAERVLAEIRAPYELAIGGLDVGASIGVATGSSQAMPIESLLREADLALRHARSAGQGGICVFDPAMSDAEHRRLTLEADLKAAVAAGAFELHYQPLLALDAERIVGVEALVRWRHPERGLVPPLDFIPLAEEIGLIVALGQWVLRQACRDASAWPSDIQLAVNVSGVQMRRPDFADAVLGILAETSLNPRRLEIEMTESVLIDESETTRRNIETLRAVGVRFAMDDFGTGYSSLSYLRRLPLDKIKIDRSFMTDAETSADALAIIRAVAMLGASLGLTTLVEGVETKAQLELVRAEGVDQVQGYLVSRPQPFDVVTLMLGRRDL